MICAFVCTEEAAWLYPQILLQVWGPISRLWAEQLEVLLWPQSGLVMEGELAQDREHKIGRIPVYWGPCLLMLTPPCPHAEALGPSFRD